MDADSDQSLRIFCVETLALCPIHDRGMCCLASRVAAAECLLPGRLTKQCVVMECIISHCKQCL